MIGESKDPSKPWSPQGFAEFAARYPATEWIPPPPELDRTPSFIAEWTQRGAAAFGHDVGIVLTPGVLAEWLPGCMRAAKREFEARGHRVLRSTVRTSRSVVAQARHLAPEIADWLGRGERFVWCTHSKGGIDALWALHARPDLSDRCVAIILVQPPIGHSWVLEHWQTRSSTLGRARAAALRARWLRDGLREISRSRDPQVTDLLADLPVTVPILHVVTWSIRPTSWIDSYHALLDELRPGHAHDGQFYLCDQRIPAAPVICLPGLDHAQPVLGGDGFDAGRFWQTLAALAWQEADRK